MYFFIQDISQVIEESGKNGFIYVSFGSMMKLEELSVDMQNVFFEAFRGIDTRFVLRWEGAPPPQLPPNVFTWKWMPQKEILGIYNLELTFFVLHDQG